MIAKAIVAASLLVSSPTVPLTSAFIPVPGDPTFIAQIQYPLVRKVSCKEGSGTAFRIGRNHWISVAHVTALHDCEVAGGPITVTDQDGKNDFSTFDTPSITSNGFKVNCGGFIPGQYYYAVGHALGLPFHTVITVYATYARWPDGKRVLIGPYDFIPGMSGGPVLNSAGEVVGTVNAFVRGEPISLSRELKDTAICGANIA